ncbi:MAG: hypothetical protein ACREAC_27900, partial [Blastocatellia bacterium]
MRRIVLPGVAAAPQRVDSIPAADITSVAAADICSVPSADVGIAIEVVVPVYVYVSRSPAASQAPATPPG